MIEFDKFTDDRDTYVLCPQEYRWIYNKLTVAEIMGYHCAPSGALITKLGTYCIRPIMSFAGRGSGGIMKFQTLIKDGKLTQPPYRPGYFWCEWFDGVHGWTDFTDDEPVYESCGFEIGEDLHMKYNYENIVYKEMPEQFKGISKHLLIEHIGGKVIEVSPRYADKVFPQLVKVYDDDGNDGFYSWGVK